MPCQLVSTLRDAPQGVTEAERRAVALGIERRLSWQHLPECQTAVRLLVSRGAPGQVVCDSGVIPKGMNHPLWELGATNCRVCDCTFGMTQRQHHCRRCGRTVCSRCTNYLHLDAALRPQRVCRLCEVSIVSGDVPRLLAVATLPEVAAWVPHNARAVEPAAGRGYLLSYTRLERSEMGPFNLFVQQCRNSHPRIVSPNPEDTNEVVPIVTAYTNPAALRLVKLCTLALQAHFDSAATAHAALCDGWDLEKEVKALSDAA